MKKLFFITLMSITSLHGMIEDRTHSLVTQDFYAVVSYNETTHMVYPVCDFHQERKCLCFYSTFFKVKDAAGSIVPYNKDIHGKLSLISTGRVLSCSSNYREWTDTWKVKPAYQIQNPDLIPLINTKLRLEQYHVSDYGRFNQSIIKEMRPCPHAPAILALMTVIGCGTYFYLNNQVNG